jgi:hypothetical protein
MEYLLFSGSHAGTKRLDICAYKGCVTLPQEVELPIKVRINGRVADVWDKWFSFRSVSEDFEKCYPAGDILLDDGSTTPLAHNIPTGGSIVGIMATCDEDSSADVIVQGNDVTGRQIFTFDKNGNKVTGERFSLTKNQIRYGKVTFGEVTGIVKPVTNGYVTMWAVNPSTDKRTFLADWSPSDTRPLYRKFRILARECPPIASVSMLARVRLRDTYLDNELTLFDNSLAILLAAQRLQGEINNDVDVANYKRQATEDILEKEAGYKRVSGLPVDIYFPLSGGSIKGIV